MVSFWAEKFQVYRTVYFLNNRSEKGEKKKFRNFELHIHLTTMKKSMKSEMGSLLDTE
jgi:hypothetical protein